MQLLLNKCVYGTALSNNKKLLSLARYLQTEDCVLVKTVYTQTWASICDTTLKSMAEVSILMALLIPVACGAAFSGLIFVNRNKVDIPISEKKSVTKVKQKVSTS